MKGPRYIETNVSKLVNSEQKYQKHREKLVEIQSKKYQQDLSHMKVLKDQAKHRNYNSMFTEQQRMSNIQKENDVLLAHLMRISGFRLRNQSVTAVEATPVKPRLNNERKSNSSVPKNNFQRQQEQERISNENMRMHKKISSLVAQISNHRHKEDWERNLKAKGIMRKFFVENDQPAVRNSGIIRKLANKNKTFSDRLSSRSSDREESNERVRENSKSRLDDTHSKLNRTADNRSSRDKQSSQQKKESSKLDISDVSKLLDVTQDRIILDIFRPGVSSADPDFQPRKHRIRKTPQIIIQSSMNSRIPTPTRTGKSFVGSGNVKLDSRSGRVMRSEDFAKSYEYQGFKESSFLAPIPLKSKENFFDPKRSSSPRPSITNLRHSRKNEGKVLNRTIDRNSRNNLSKTNNSLSGHYSGRKSPIQNEKREKSDKKSSSNLNQSNLSNTKDQKESALGLATSKIEENNSNFGIVTDNHLQHNTQNATAQLSQS